VNDVLVLGSRIVLGGYLAAHGAQKLFGVLEGPGLEKAAAGFEHLGLTPGKPMVGLAGGAELVGGTLIATGAAHPLGPIAVSGAMTVASLVHAPNGPFSQKGGYELAATNLAFAAALAAMGTGRYAIGGRLPGKVTAVLLAGAAALTGVSAAKVLRKRRQPPPAAEPAPSADGEVREAAAD
jgi:putative oxidoreductase